MKLSTKPISSPGRTDKFPPPLMRFLRSNVGSRSRGRSRSNSSTTLFVRKKNTSIETTTTTTQEPSSPKVTCMGQVRVKRSSKSKQPNKRTRAAVRAGATSRCSRCWWIRKTINPCRCQPAWPKWGSFFRAGSFRRKSTKLKTELPKTESEAEHEEQQEEEEDDEESEYGAIERVMNVDNVSSIASNSCTPPRNALLLTRCRSAPYRSSSLASRFWGSPLRSEEETEEKQGNENRGSSFGENERPPLERKLVSDEDAKRVSENEEKLGFFKELEDSLRDRIVSMKKSENGEELKKREKGEGDCEEAPRPVVLTRCKSEPASAGFKLDPEVNNFLKKRKLGLAADTS
ncbi:hypothetical protein RIF29_39991 [Crotalaria pallida]|uniref:Uncharacterized protein n=1 Tax=Crotalaria pallida TaxID=3830 RepID=A0AAN9E3X0_CROPI